MLNIVSSVLVAACAMLGIVPPVIQFRVDSLNGPTLRPIPKGPLEVVTNFKDCKAY